MLVAAGALAAVSCSDSRTVSGQARPQRQLHPWVVLNDSSSFAEIEPVKDMIASISVFGNPSREYIDRCHEAGIEVYHAVGGNEESIDSSEKIAALTEAYVADCTDNGYDGVDLDFENLDPATRPVYTEFLRQASDALHKAGKKMSHCVGFYPVLAENPEAKIFYSPAVLDSVCDLVRVMCYDMYFAPGIGVADLAGRDDCQGMGPTSDYEWTRRAMEYWKERVAPEKLVMALPAYGNDYRVTGDIAGRQIYAPVPDGVAGELPAPVWLCYEKVNAYIYDHEDGSRHIFYAADDRSTDSLLALADELQVPKVGFWHFSTVAPRTWEVTRRWFGQ